MNKAAVVKEMIKLKNPQKAKILQSFFKTKRGEYGEGDIFWGLTVPQTRRLAKKYKDLILSECQKLLQSKVHEQRLLRSTHPCFTISKGQNLSSKRTPL